jgi:hypothetical protein
MKFAISYSTPFYGVDPDKIIAYAQQAEDCGFESLSSGQRVWRCLLGGVLRTQSRGPGRGLWSVRPG